MGDLRRIAERITELLEDMKIDGEVLPTNIGRNIPDAISSDVHGANTINLYPYGKHNVGCCDFALFLSLQTSAYIKKGRRGHLNFENAIQKIVQHMQGSCVHNTRTALLITDNYDGDAFQAWRANLEQIRKHAQLELYLIDGKGILELPL